MHGVVIFLGISILLWSVLRWISFFLSCNITSTTWSNMLRPIIFNNVWNFDWVFWKFNYLIISFLNHIFCLIIWVLIWWIVWLFDYLIIWFFNYIDYSDILMFFNFLILICSFLWIFFDFYSLFWYFFFIYFFFIEFLIPFFYFNHLFCFLIFWFSYFFYFKSPIIIKQSKVSLGK